MTTDDRPMMTGREHWLEAERLLAAAVAPDVSTYAVAAITSRAKAHALLALAAPAYAFHQARGQVVADSPNITPGVNEGPHRCLTDECQVCGVGLGGSPMNRYR